MLPPPKLVIERSPANFRFFGCGAGNSLNPCAENVGEQNPAVCLSSASALLSPVADPVYKQDAYASPR